MNEDDIVERFKFGDLAAALKPYMETHIKEFLAEKEQNSEIDQTVLDLSNVVEEINKNLEILQASVDKHSSQISTVSNKLNETHDKTNGLSGKINELNAEISRLGSQLATEVAGMSAITKRLDETGSVNETDQKMNELLKKQEMIWSTLAIQNIHLTPMTVRKEGEYRKKLDEMLQRMPDTDNEKVQELWSKLKPLNTQLLSDYAKKIDPNFHVINAADAHFTDEDWSVEKSQYTGMRKNHVVGVKDQKKNYAHGIARVVKSDGTVKEGTLKNGAWFGFYRVITEHHVSVHVHNPGQAVSQVKFNSELGEVAQTRKGDALTDLVASNVAR